MEITLQGAKYRSFLDRSFVILNENNSMVTQRTKPKLALIQTSLLGEYIALSLPGKETIYVDVTEDLSKNEKVEFQIWKQPTAGVVCRD